MIAKLRDAKEQLSELVKRAAEGEEIVITVRGQPMARLTSATPGYHQGRSHESWVAEMTATAKSLQIGAPQTTPQSAWDDLRSDRC